MRFSRADTGVATTAQGTGLGLYLVRQLAQAGGLDVTYQPNQPRGSVFRITVPCSPGPAARAPQCYAPTSARRQT